MIDSLLVLIELYQFVDVLSVDSNKEKCYLHYQRLGKTRGLQKISIIDVE